MRRELLPGVLQVAKLNLENIDSIAVYELGFVYLPTKDKLPTAAEGLVHCCS